MTDRDWRIFKEDSSIVARSTNVPKPMRTWAESDLPAELLDAIATAGYDEPTPIQRYTIPIGLQRRDLIGLAETGSGKTASFVLPMLVHISSKPPIGEHNASQGPYALIMAPTREMVQQIHDETLKFATALGMKSFALVGGVSMEEQAFMMGKGCEILVATPGRLNDCFERRDVVFNNCKYVILDETDRMIDMGFEPQLSAVLDFMPAPIVDPEGNVDPLSRTTIMFSVTMPPSVERLAKKYLRKPAFVAIGTTGPTARNVEQQVEWVKNENEKKSRLEELLKEYAPPIIVFLNTRKTCDDLFKYLERMGYRCSLIHSGRPQETREAAIEAFKDRQTDILVATGLVGRGIDVSGVTMVLNYELPPHIDDYTRRIGRTGRAGLTGTAISFLSNEDTSIMLELKRTLERSNASVPNELANHEAALFKASSGSSRTIDTKAMDRFLAEHDRDTGGAV